MLFSSLFLINIAGRQAHGPEAGHSGSSRGAGPAGPPDRGQYWTAARSQ